MGKVLPLRVSPKGAAPERLEDRSDEELMALVRLGTRPAFRILVVRHAAKVAGFCARITGDRAAAPEIAQEVWLAIWDARERWEPRSTFRSYLFMVAFSRAKNHTRSRRRAANVFAQEVAAADTVAAPGEQEIDHLLARERRERVFDAVSELPEAMREAVISRFVDDLSYEEMEKVLSTNASTLRSRVHHALARLRDRLGKEPR
jgi:RNA polymerase sigma-70 factor (ECF subfamily)